MSDVRHPVNFFENKLYTMSGKKTSGTFLMVT